MKRRRLLLISGLACLRPFASFGQALPNLATATIEPPRIGIPPIYAQFVAKWGGYWGGTLASNLIVESMTEAGEWQAVYAWGTNQFVPTPGTRNLIGQITEGKLTWGDPLHGIGFAFSVLSDGRLQGYRWDHGVETGSVIMTRM